MQLLTEIYTTGTVICFISSQWNNYWKQSLSDYFKVFKHTFNKYAAFSLHKFLQDTSQN